MQPFYEYMSDETARRLMKTLIQMVDAAPLDRISTSDLLKQAGVSRSTFYRRYQDKYDLLNTCYQELLDQTLFRVSGGTSYRTAFFSLYTVLQENPVFFKRALSSTDHNSLRNYIYKQSYSVYESILDTYGMDMKRSDNRLLLAGFITGTLEVTCIWAQSGMKESVDTLFRLCYQLMPDEIRTCISLYYM